MQSIQNLLRNTQYLAFAIRSIGRYRGRKPYVYEGEGIKYPGFTYYPRSADFKDPPYEPTKLLKVRRIKPLKNNPYWHKNLLKELHLDVKQSDIAIVKNTPKTTAMLWRIKHLIEIKPINLPKEQLENADLTAARLKENGDVTIGVGIDKLRMEATEKFLKDRNRLDGDTLRRHSRKKWLSGWFNCM